jgi:Tol biopolymer transport system component
LALAFFAFASPARATFPGANGKIVYDGAAGIYSINPDGSAPTQLTDTSCCGSVDLDPTWSPDGTKIAFERSPEVDFGEIWVMNADGSGQTAIAYSLSFDPAWSPDGSRLAFYWAGSDPGL